MSTELAVLYFVIIALMRVIQRVCSKRVCNIVQGKTFFHYGGYYNLVAALFSLISVAYVGFQGFDIPTVLCAFGTAFFLTIGLFASLEALKGASLIVNQMFCIGGLFIPCIVGIFLFNEPMNVWEWAGLVLFMVSMYFMVAPADGKNAEPSKKISLKTFAMLIVCLLSEGGTMVMQKLFGVYVPNGNESMYSFLMFAIDAVILYLCYAILLLIKRKPEQREISEQSEASAKRLFLGKELLICGAFLALAVFFINLLVTIMAGKIPSAVLFSVSNGISIIIALLVGWFCYHEKVGVKNVIGIVLCVGSIAMINFL